MASPRRYDMIVNGLLGPYLEQSSLRPIQYLPLLLATRQFHTLYTTLVASLRESIKDPDSLTFLGQQEDFWVHLTQAQRDQINQCRSSVDDPTIDALLDTKYKTAINNILTTSPANIPGVLFWLDSWASRAPHQAVSYFFSKKLTDEQRKNVFEADKDLNWQRVVQQFIPRHGKNGADRVDPLRTRDRHLQGPKLRF